MRTFFKIFVFTLLFIFIGNNVYATCKCPTGSSLSYPASITTDAQKKAYCESKSCTWEGGTGSDSGSGKTTNLENPLGEINSPQKLIGQIINTLLGVVGSLALIMFIFGGITWMTAAGSQDKVKKGRDILVWATLGLVVVFASYSLVKFIIAGVGA
jgi:type IV secretory pathway VirB2 component (pilin)